MIKFIYFDVGSVIVDNDYSKMSIARQHNISYEKVLKVFEENWKAGCRGTLSNRKYHEIVKRELGISHSSGDVTDLRVEYQKPIEETHTFIHEIKSQYRLGILSNAEKTALEKQIKKGHIPNINWEVIVESAQYGVIKPDPKIYEIAESFVPDLKPHELFFIDDHIEMVEAAKKRGWSGEVFDPKDRKESIKRIQKSITLHQ
ncbi:MAG: HAD hydrolase-like protein [Patescibacteria group bacterium]